MRTNIGIGRRVSRLLRPPALALLVFACGGVKGLAYDGANGRLYAADNTANRILIFNIP
ncbi:MAG: hypothetical protein HYT87_00095 [Nitrospirae bacterium]|nr:hypothetical protein [Nitrospirota bacterium]